MTRLLVVRHGESTWNAAGRWQGQADPPLSARGVAQATEAAAALAGTVDAIWTSDLARAHRTATIVGDAVGLEPHAEPRLREREAGPWGGLTRAEINAGWPGHLDTGARPPGYETDGALLARADDALDAICAAHDGATVLVVTHGGVIRAFENSLGAERHRIPNLGGRWVHRDGAGWVLGELVALSSIEGAHPGERR